MVHAYWYVAEGIGEQKASATQKRDHRAALSDVVRAFQSSRLPAGSLAAEHAAHAQFLLVDNIEDFENWRMNIGKPKTLEEYLGIIIPREINAGASRVETLRADYDTVMPFKRPQWIISAYVQQARGYEALVKTILDTPLVIPNDLQQAMRGFDEYEREDMRYQIEDGVRQILDPLIRPFECLAVVRYALTLRAGRAASLDNETTRFAIERIQAYGDERIAECVTEHQAKDATFDSYRPGEFDRAPRGLTLTIPEGVAAPTVEEAP